MSCNKTIGNGYEQEFCNLMFKKGWWVTNLAQKTNGQPADVLAVRYGTALLIDCKVCNDNKFPFSRIEENQRLAMTLWKERGNGTGWFALLLGGETYMFSYSTLQLMELSKAGLNAQQIKELGIPFDEWEEGLSYGYNLCE